MNAREFNAQVSDILEPVLADAGFRKVRSSFVREDSTNQLVLFRFSGSKFAALGQFTRFMLCFRHTFLRDLWEAVPESYPEEGNAYPFRAKPSSLEAMVLSEWSYHFELNPSEYDQIDFGQLNDAAEILGRMGQLVSIKGVQWAERLGPEEALRQLESSQANAFCERLWIEDYRNALATRAE